MKKLKIVSLILVLTFLLAMFAACAAPAPAQSSAPAKASEPATPASASPSVESSKPAESASNEILIAHLPKSIGGAWYTRMYEGFKRIASLNKNVTTVQIGNSKADSALQNAAIEDFITQAQGKKAILCMSFVSPEASEQVLKKAKDAGIIVIGNEGINANNVEYDMEAFDNTAFGQSVADELATLMAKKGKLAIIVGKLSSSTHMAWADAVKESVKSKYPDIEIVTDPYIEGNYDQQQSYDKTKELVKKYPDINGFFCTSATDAAGVARAIDEGGLADKTSFVSLGTPDLYVDYIKSGAVDVLTGWDPSMLGEAMCDLGQKILAGEKIENGMNLGVFGFDKIILDGKVIKGNTWQRIDIKNVDEILKKDYGK